MTDDAERTCAGMNLHGKDIKIFAGNSNKPLAAAMAECLGITLGRSEVGRFSDGEIQVSIQESVRGSDVYVVQSTSSPVNRNLMELLIMIDACRRASAGRITAVIPYFGYARQDRKAKGRDPISAKLVANMIEAAGADRVLTMDLHASQIQGFFDIPVDNLLSNPIFVKYYMSKFEHPEEMVVVSPDVGSVARSRTFANKMGMNLAIVDKRREKANQCEVMNVIGDVKDKKCILFDDMVDTAGSLCNAAKAIVEIGGATEVYACATHGVLSGPANERIANSCIKELTFLNTIPPLEGACSKIKYLSVAPMFAEAIERIYHLLRPLIGDDHDSNFVPIGHLSIDDIGQQRLDTAIDKTSYAMQYPHLEEPFTLFCETMRDTCGFTYLLKKRCSLSIVRCTQRLPMRTFTNSSHVRISS